MSRLCWQTKRAAEATSTAALRDTRIHLRLSSTHQRTLLTGPAMSRITPFGEVRYFFIEPIVVCDWFRNALRAADPGGADHAQWTNYLWSYPVPVPVPVSPELAPAVLPPSLPFLIASLM